MNNDIENVEERELEEVKAKPKKKRKKRKFRFFATFMALTIGATGTGAYYLYRNNQLDDVIEGIYQFLKPEKDFITEMSERLPLDENGIISITFPVVDRKQANLYSLPTGYSPYFVSEDINMNNLNKVNDNGLNVDNYQTSNGDIPIGYVGVSNEYLDFLMQVKNIKDSIINGKSNYAIQLAPANYEVSNLYYLKSGFELYSKDPAMVNEAKLAYISDNGDKIFNIPAELVNNFIGVTKSTYEVIVKYDNLRSQLQSIYETYTVKEDLNVQEEGNLSR